MAEEKYIEIGGRLHSIATGNVSLGANEVFDDDKNKKQSDINAETDAAIEDRYTKEQTYSKSELNNLITTPNQQYVSVTATAQTTSATDVLPATGAANTVYRVGNWDGSQFDASVYSEYAWNGSSYVHLNTKTQVGEVFNISAYHATGGTLATYADLAAALDSNNGGGVPQSLRKGGMSIKFVQSSDNKYVQYRFLLSTFTDAQFTNTTNWQGVDDEPIAGSDNLVKSGGVAKVCNVWNANVGQPTSTFTLFQAIQSIPFRLRRVGMLVVFRITLGVTEVYKYTRGDLTDTGFLNTSYWEKVSDSNIINYNRYANAASVNVGDVLTTTILETSTLPRMPYSIMVIKDNNYVIKYWQYQQMNIDDTNWLNLDNWLLVLKSDSIKLLNDRLDRNTEIIINSLKKTIPINQSGQVYNTGSFNIDDTFSDALSTNASYNCVKIPVTKGMVVGVKGQGGVVPRLYCVTDTAFKIKKLADSSLNIPNYIEIPITEDGYVYINVNNRASYTTGEVYIYTKYNAEGIVKSKNIPVTFTNTGKAFNVGSSYSVGDTYVVSLSGNPVINSAMIPVAQYDKVFIKGKGAANPRLYFITDANLKILKIADIGLDTDGKYIELDIIEDGYVFINVRNDEEVQPDAYIVSDFNLEGVYAATRKIYEQPKEYNFPNSGQVYNTGNYGVGDTYVESLTSNGSFDSVKIPVSKYDVVHIKGRGGSMPRLYCLTDKSLKIKELAPVTAIFYEIQEIFIEEDGYIYINVSKDTANYPREVYIDNVQNLEAVANKLYPKPKLKWLAMGDSITEGYYSYLNDSQVGVSSISQNLTYVPKLAILNNWEYVNRGIGGSGYFFDRYGQLQNARTLVNTFTAEYMAQFDLCTLMYGINDYKSGVTAFGSMNDDPDIDNTFIANVRYTIKKLQQLNPTMKIIVITPLNAIGYSFDYGDESTCYALGHQIATTDDGNKTLQDYVDAIKNVCEYYGIEYIDMSRKSIINSVNIATLLPDGVHPSVDAHSCIAKQLSRKIDFV